MPTNDPDKKKEQWKRYYEKNKEKIYARQREWYHANKHRPEIKEMYDGASKRWREEHREQWLESKRASSKRYYENHKEEERARSREKRAKQIAHLIAIVDEAKSAGCVLCGEDDPILLDFHHIDPSTKTCSVAELVRIRNPTEDELRAEIAKCVILDVKCHRKVERGVLTIPAHITDYRR